MLKFENRHLEEAFRRHLRQNETVIWHFENAAGPELYRRSAILGLAVTLVLIVAFAAFEMMALTGNVGETWRQNATGHLLIGLVVLGISFAVHFRKFLRRNQFAYALTDQRLFIMNSQRPIWIDTYHPGQIAGLVSYGTQECGTVVIDPYIGHWFVQSFRFYPRQLSNIPNPNHVEKLVRETLVSSKMAKEQDIAARNHKLTEGRKSNLFHGH